MYTTSQIRAAERDLDDPQWYRRSSSAARAYVLATREAQRPKEAATIGVVGWLVIALAVAAWLPIVIAILL